MSSQQLSARAGEIVTRALAEAKACETPEGLESVRLRYLGRRGELNLLLRELGSVPPDERPRAGEALNRAKRDLTEALTGLFEERSAGPAAGGTGADVTLPGRRPAVGRKHPLTRITEELLAVFRHLGFDVREGPEVETEYYNFEALNTPPWHPSRDEQDSFYLAPGIVLRTHTSPVQIHVMESQPPPVRIVAPGRCYRRDNPDATHAVAFHQVEGLYVDRGVTFAHLRGTLETFAHEIFGPGTRVRFRPSYFPFTEPSAEMDVRYARRRGDGEEREEWLEIMGCGMVHPAVLRAVGYDPEEFTGFAFGMGFDRIAMLRYDIDDIRLLMENDRHFLEQF
jgi:phenylalanyl-tRNA synthetase alpha chain